ncbi:MAG: hypothetical protein OXI43_13595 [Candidatus Poribacteria bacterium]|nr:hypothetical protein [Candidatus Poribacteria bacterium]
MSNERLTLEEMTEKYPDQWLFIIDCEISENTELLSGVVFAHSESRDDISEVSSNYEGSAAIHWTGGLPEGMRYLL